MNNNSRVKKYCPVRYMMLADIGIAIVLIISSMLVIWYISMYMQDRKIEGMCGGSDQGCHCSGNETFVAYTRII